MLYVLNASQENMMGFRRCSQNILSIHKMFDNEQLLTCASKTDDNQNEKMGKLGSSFQGNILVR